MIYVNFYSTSFVVGNLVPEGLQLLYMGVETPDGLRIEWKILVCCVREWRCEYLSGGLT